MVDFTGAQTANVKPKEIDKCKQLAKSALAGGDAEKATRLLQKAKRMCPTDTSIDELIAAAQVAGASAGASSPSAKGDSDGNPTASEGFRHRASATSTSSGASSNVRTGKDGRQYTTEQMQLVQRILRTKDYYDILEVPKNANEDVAKKAYRKLALKLHPDKNRAPGADEAFKKLSKAFQCLTDPEKKQVYDTYGDEERIPQQQRHHYQQDFMTPEDLFAAFFGGGPVFHQHQRHHAHHQDDGQVQRMQIFQALPVLLLVLLTLSNFGKDSGGGRFSFQANNAYRNERSTATLNVPYYVTDDFEEHYSEGTRSLAEFDRQVEIYHIRNLGSDCDYQEKTQYKKVLQAKRRRNEEELQEARNLPRPACKELERVKKKFPNLFRSAMYMGGY
ncbi:Dnajb12 [Symbiodinium natans]|uniref:Dnajb12 protein n=1 Tax=Symbiodinium natans TaxID=878477 RepID=A0A812MXA1_9DINO|nr:Dnajb12 [Symbiodinium natans]